MATVDYVDASCIYPGATAPSVDKLNLDLQDGEFMVLVGPSGSGKSTALRMLAGLEEVASGEIRIDGTDVSQQAAEGPRHRDGVPELRAVPAHERRREHGLRAEAQGRVEGRADEEGPRGRRPCSTSSTSSTASRRRCPVVSASASRWAARSCASPRVFLMDEPLSNLDAKLRVETRANIAQLQARLGTTTLYVTHDQVEAMTMGHRVALLKDGKLQQVDTPRNLYDRPGNAFVAGFIGSPAMNLRVVDLVDGGAQLGNIVLPLQPRGRSRPRAPRASSRSTSACVPSRSTPRTPAAPAASARRDRPEDRGQARRGARRRRLRLRRAAR